MTYYERVLNEAVARLKVLPIPLEQKIKELIESAKLLGFDLSEDEARRLLES
jgi:hypothetical protein